MYACSLRFLLRYLVLFIYFICSFLSLLSTLQQCHTCAFTWYSKWLIWKKNNPYQTMIFYFFCILLLATNINPIILLIHSTYVCQIIISFIKHNLPFSYKQLTVFIHQFWLLVWKFGWIIDWFHCDVYLQ